MKVVLLFMTAVLIGAPGPNELSPKTLPIAETASRTIVLSPQSLNSIIGHVFDTSRRPVGQVVIELQDDYYASIARTRTSDSGLYAFNNLPYGVYQIKVEPHGTNFESQSRRVQIESMSRSGRSGQSLQEDFVLVLRSESGRTGTSKPGVIFAQEVPEAARKVYEDAIKVLDSGKSVEAGLEMLRKAIGIYPNYYLALERLGTEYVKREQYDSATDVLTKAVGVNPRADQSFYWLGIAEYQLKNISAAIDSLRRAVAASPASVNSQMWFGKALWKDGRFDEAETHFRQAYKLGGRQVPIVHLYLAQLYDRQKRYREEANELELYLKEEPNPVDPEKIAKAIKNLRTKAG